MRSLDFRALRILLTSMRSTTFGPCSSSELKPGDRRLRPKQSLLCRYKRNGEWAVIPMDVVDASVESIVRRVQEVRDVRVCYRPLEILRGFAAMHVDI